MFDVIGFFNDLKNFFSRDDHRKFLRLSTWEQKFQVNALSKNFPVIQLQGHCYLFLVGIRYFLGVYHMVKVPVKFSFINLVQRLFEKLPSHLDDGGIAFYGILTIPLNFQYFHKSGSDIMIGRYRFTVKKYYFYSLFVGLSGIVRISSSCVQFTNK